MGGCGRPAPAGLRGCRRPRRAREPGPARCRARSPRPGPASTGRPSRSASSWHSSAFCAPPPTTCTRSHGRAGQARRPARRACANAVGEAVARCCATSRRPGPPVRARRARGTTPRSGPGMSPGGEEPRVVHVEDRHRAVVRRGLLEQQPGRRGRGSPQCGASPTSSQMPITLVQEADPPVDAALVGEVGGPRLLGDHRLRRARRRPAPRCRRRCTPRRGSVIGTPTTAEAVSCEPTVTRPASPSMQVADHGARVDRARRAGAAAQADAAPAARCPTSPVRTSSSPVVEALVRSQTSRPVSQ